MKVSKQTRINASLLDKLIDDAPNEKASEEHYRGINLAQLRRNVARDIENLLNAKVQWSTWPECYTELNDSLVNYGLSDFSSVAIGSLEGRKTLCEKVAESIRRFEPRFIEVDVETVDNEQCLDRILKLRINALLYADPDPEYISFDSEVEPVHLSMKVMECA
ncbi:type VI secretion system baseplate subunit TssE [Psychromonas antarctica]|jgi:type VI secretion system protein ImpF|uniref:type VI secretion system baseplate subunit TssE n=1 Tax=Psychromonas antarctica TaxID=67573 RepID=UPI001EE87FF8|nr:type VI secretion system baseplate subunit TssE [Psychromonas antarctica]MCG6202375.1 type VI secretion system baseplate subunit TssE [Psychromonas antarctica]